MHHFFWVCFGELIKSYFKKFICDCPNLPIIAIQPAPTPILFGSSFPFFVFFVLIKLKSHGLLNAIIKIMKCHNVVSLREIGRGFKWSSCTCSQCSLIKVKANKDSSEYSYLHYNGWWTTLVIKLARFGLSWGWCTFYQKQKCVQIKYFSSLETAIEHQPAS